MLMISIINFKFVIEDLPHWIVKNGFDQPEITLDKFCAYVIMMVELDRRCNRCQEDIEICTTLPDFRAG